MTEPAEERCPQCEGLTPQMIVTDDMLGDLQVCTHPWHSAKVAPEPLGTCYWNVKPHGMDDRLFHGDRGCLRWEPLKLREAAIKVAKDVGGQFWETHMLNTGLLKFINLLDAGESQPRAEGQTAREFERFEDWARTKGNGLRLKYLILEFDKLSLNPLEYKSSTTQLAWLGWMGAEAYTSSLRERLDMYKDTINQLADQGRKLQERAEKAEQLIVEMAAVLRPAIVNLTQGELDDLLARAEAMAGRKGE